MTICEEITALFPIRRTKEQKQAFRQWVTERIAGMGWTVRTEANARGHQQNLIVGDPEHAEFICTAHYDTPANILLPDLQIPRSFPVYLLYQMVLIIAMLGIAFLAGAAAGLATQSGDVMLLTFFGAFVALMAVQLYGPANRHNVNDNTSGVAALMEAMADIPEDARDKVAFILFDNMEKGRKGSKAYAAEHQQMQYTAFVVNLDSVGVGDTFVAAVPSLVRQLPQYERLTDILHRGGRDVRFHSAATTRSNSDFRSFKCGVGITAYRQVSGVGLYLGDLHTARDTHADEANIAFLAQALSALAAECASAADASADSSAEG